MCYFHRVSGQYHNRNHDKTRVWKKNVAEIVDRYKATFGDVPCTAYEVYCGIGEILFLAQSKGVSGRAMVELEEKVAKCLSVKWREYDIPGDLVY